MLAADPKTLDLYPIDYPFETLVDRIKAGKLLLNPDFQRDYKWDKSGWERASKFIESCLMRIPLPSCYFAEDEQSRHLVIDGVQRLTTILNFFGDEFALEGLTTFSDLEGKRFSELGDHQADLENSTIRCIILRKANPKRIVREIFSRLNQGAVSLSPQEVRHALYPGDFDSLLTELAKSPTVATFGQGPRSRTKRDSREADELVLRYFAFRDDFANYDGRNLGKFLDTYMESKSATSDAEIASMRDDFNRSLRKCISVFGKTVFMDTSKTRKRQSIVYYDLLMHSMSTLSDEQVDEKKEEIMSALGSLFKSAPFQRALAGGLQNKSSITTRRKIWESLLAKATG